MPNNPEQENPSGFEGKDPNISSQDSQDKVPELASPKLDFLSLYPQLYQEIVKNEFLSQSKFERVSTILQELLEGLGKTIKIIFVDSSTEVENGLPKVPNLGEVNYIGAVNESHGSVTLVSVVATKEIATFHILKKGKDVTATGQFYVSEEMLKDRSRLIEYIAQSVFKALQELNVELKKKDSLKRRKKTSKSRQNKSGLERENNGKNVIPDLDVWGEILTAALVNFK